MSCSITCNIRPAVTEPPQYLNLHRKSPHQPSDGRPERRRPPLGYEGGVHLGKDCHRSRMGAGHLDGERSLDLIFRSGVRMRRQ